MSSIYDAVPLEHGTSTNIRVIEILHNVNGEDPNLISCKLHTISLEDSPVYAALSYTWGSPDETKIILLDGQ